MKGNGIKLTIGDRLKRYRENAALSQDKLSKLSGVSLSLIRMIERNEHSNVSVNVVQKLADVLKVGICNIIESNGLEELLPAQSVEYYTENVKTVWLPIFNNIPTEDDLSLKRLSNLVGMLPSPTGYLDYYVILPDNMHDDTILGGPGDILLCVNSKDPLLGHIYLIKNEKGFYLRVYTEYEDGKGYFIGLLPNRQPFLRKSSEVYCEVVGFIRNPSKKNIIRDHLPKS